MLPSLCWLCLRRVAQINRDFILPSLPFRLNLTDGTPLALDITRLVHRGFDASNSQLWAVLVQVYDNLPPAVASLKISLRNPRVRLFQKIRPTSNFAFLTVLDLPGCQKLKDDAATTVAQLHTLAALDVSETALSPYFFAVLARKIVFDLQEQHNQDSARRGPWMLRVVRLYRCLGIDNTVYAYLKQFPLLSVIDLRGTQCGPPPGQLGFHSATSEQLTPYHPTPLGEALHAVLPSSQQIYTLHINSLEFTKSRTLSRPDLSVAPQNSFVVIPSNGKSSIQIQDTETLEWENQRLHTSDRQFQHHGIHSSLHRDQTSPDQGAYKPFYLDASHAESDYYDSDRSLESESFDDVGSDVCSVGEDDDNKRNDDRKQDAENINRDHDENDGIDASIKNTLKHEPVAEAECSPTTIGLGSPASESSTDTRPMNNAFVSTAQFYGSTKVSSLPKNYTSELYYDDILSREIRAERLSPLLMLYRDPTRPLERNSGESTKSTSPKLKLRKGVKSAALATLKDSAERKFRPDTLQQSKTNHVAVEEPIDGHELSGRNPFRRRIDYSSKSLKPISALKIPMPPPCVPTNKPKGKSIIGIAGRDGVINPRKARSRDGPHEREEMPVGIKRASSSAIDLKATKKIKMPNQTPVKDSGTKSSFDWAAWRTK